MIDGSPRAAKRIHLSRRPLPTSGGTDAHRRHSRAELAPRGFVLDSREARGCGWQTPNVSEPRRHHYVQRAYLDRFAEGGQLCVRRRDGRSFRSSSRNIAVETGFYDVTDDSGNRSTAVETQLGEVEGLAMAALNHIDDVGRPPGESTPERTALARYMALQATRTPEERERIFFARRVARYAGQRQVTRELVAEYLERVHLGFEPSDNGGLGVRVGVG